MTIREKLLQIADHSSDEHAALAEIANELNDLRCDNCAYWKKDGAFMECLHPSNRWPDRDCDCEEYLSPKPDFFCALFEHK